MRHTPVPFDERSKCHPFDEGSVAAMCGTSQKGQPGKQGVISFWRCAAADQPGNSTETGSPQTIGEDQEEDARSDTLTDERGEVESLDDRDFFDPVSEEDEEGRESPDGQEAKGSVLTALLQTGTIGLLADCNVGDLPTAADLKPTANFACTPSKKIRKKEPLLESSNDGIDFVFELVESAVCGSSGFSPFSKQQESTPLPTPENLPVYAMHSGNHSIVQSTCSTKSGQISCDQSVASSHGSSRSASSNRRRRSKSRDIPRRTSTYRGSSYGRTSKSPTEISQEFASRSVSNDAHGSSVSFKVDHHSAFEEVSSKGAPATASQAVTETTASVSGMRELCILSIGSSVSSMDNDASQWSKPRSESPRNPIKALSIVIAFVSTFAATLEGSGAAPVNKGLCFVACVIAILLWPESMETDRVRIEKKDPPKQVSLLSLASKN